jgi:integrase-like protein
LVPGDADDASVLKDCACRSAIPEQEIKMVEMSPLRRRVIEDMTVRNLSPATQPSYIHAVAKFSRYFGRSPARLGLEDVRAFQVHLVAKGISWAALNQTVCALAPQAARGAERG